MPRSKKATLKRKSAATEERTATARKQFKKQEHDRRERAAPRVSVCSRSRVGPARKIL